MQHTTDYTWKEISYGTHSSRWNDYDKNRLLHRLRNLLQTQPEDVATMLTKTIFRIYADTMIGDGWGDEGGVHGSQMAPFLNVLSAKISQMRERCNQPVQAVANLGTGDDSFIDEDTDDLMFHTCLANTVSLSSLRAAEAESGTSVDCRPLERKEITLNYDNHTIDRLCDLIYRLIVDNDSFDCVLNLFKILTADTDMWVETFEGNESQAALTLIAIGEYRINEGSVFAYLDLMLHRYFVANMRQTLVDFKP